MIGKKSPTPKSGAILKGETVVNYNLSYSKSQVLKNNKGECELLNPSRACESTLREILGDALPFDFCHKIINEFESDIIDLPVCEISGESAVDGVIDEIVFKIISEVNTEISVDFIRSIEKLLFEVESDLFFTGGVDV